jgi:putative transposase
VSSDFSALSTSRIRRNQIKKVKLRWSVLGGARRSLGWVPFKASALRYRNGQLVLSGLAKPRALWDSYGLAGYELSAGSIKSENARGRLYISITVKVPRRECAVGLDLGLKDFVASSDGDLGEAQQFYRDLEPALALAQRARKKARVKALHAKIANRRKSFLLQLRPAWFAGTVQSLSEM